MRILESIVEQWQYGASGWHPGSGATLIERYYLVIMLAIFNAIPFLVGDQAQGVLSVNALGSIETVSKEGDANKQIVLLILYGIGLIFLLRLQLRFILLLGTPLLMLMMLCVASSLWSDDLSLSLRRSTALLGTVIFGTYIGLRFELRETLRLMSYVTAILLIGSLVLAAISPSLGLDYEGRLRGVFAHKNLLGAYAALGLFTLCARLFETNYHSKMAALGDGLLVILCAGCLALSRSASPIPVLVVTLLLLPIARIMATADEKVLAFFPALTAIAFMALATIAYSFNIWLAVLGRDADLSGRVQVWNFVTKMIFEHPWFGYGYGTFWTGSDSPGAAFWRMANIAVTHAHNGYLQLVLDVGTVGLALTLAATATLVFRLSWLLRSTREPHIAWAFAFLGFFLVSNLTETRLWVGNEIGTALFVYVVVRTNLLFWREKSVSSHVPAEFSPV